MIKSFGDKITEKIFNGERVRHVSPDLEKSAIKKLDMINFVTGLEQLRIPPGNHALRSFPAIRQVFIPFV
ncbi:MAG: hypothetical protein U9R02_00480 [Thermodesulfobacteriota bacterium]|nr:hypothetical protein [Thermodesulfobacteriota bacterium]